MFPDGKNVLIAGQNLSNQQAKIAWGLPTPILAMSKSSDALLDHITDYL
jgi:hypothetical protein